MILLSPKAIGREKQCHNRKMNLQRQAYELKVKKLFLLCHLVLAELRREYTNPAHPPKPHDQWHSVRVVSHDVRCHAPEVQTPEYLLCRFKTLVREKYIRLDQRHKVSLNNYTRKFIYCLYNSAILEVNKWGVALIEILRGREHYVKLLLRWWRRGRFDCLRFGRVSWIFHRRSLKFNAFYELVQYLKCIHFSMGTRLNYGPSKRSQQELQDALK